METGLFYLFETLGKKSVTECYDQALDELCYAEELGFAAAHPAEHHFSNHYGIMPRVEMFLANLAGRTSRLGLRPSLIVAPLGDPLRMAEDCAMLDVLSHGRFTFSIGTGYRKYEFDKFGRDIQENGQRLRETAEIIQAAWTNERFSYQGEHFQYDDVCLVPKPERPDGSIPETWVSTATPDTMSWAAKNGFTVLHTAGFTIQAFTKAHGKYRAAALEHGRDPDAVKSPFFKWIFVAPTDEEALDVGCKAFLQTIKAFFVGGERLIALLTKSIELPADAPTDMDSLLVSKALGAFVYGSPESVVEQLRPFVKAGGDYFVGGFNIGALPTQAIRRSMELYAGDVMPALAEIE
jgi:alkanesulfonate monooxygenase SsuD/methylene tetrahydromethanopterin reductase-like flavin-dependent oxidoreductase (luciferase family)